MVTLDSVVKMLKDIDSMEGRNMSKSSLSYDKKTLAFIINNGYVAVVGDRVTRLFYGYNYDVISI